jgi:hypothetical protein
VWAVFLGRITPPQPIAIYEDYATQNAPVINARYAMALGEDGFQTLHLVQRENSPPDCFLIRFTHSARKDCSLIGLLAERESRSKGEINRS